MTKLDMLYNLANKHNIQIHFFDLTATALLFESAIEHIFIL